MPLSLYALFAYLFIGTELYLVWWFSDTSEASCEERSFS